MSVIVPERTTISTTPDRFEPIWIDPGRTPHARRDASVGATSVADRGRVQERGLSTITARPLLMDDLTADVLALFELVDNDRKDQLLDYWQQVHEKQRAAKAATA